MAHRKKPCIAVYEDGTSCDRINSDGGNRCDRHRREYNAGVPYTRHSQTCKSPNMTWEELIVWLYLEEQVRTQPAPYPELQGDCLIWKRGKKKQGLPYSLVVWKNKKYKGHVLSWSLHNGRKPRKGFDVAHLCDNADCIQPWHLDEQTRKQNMEHAVAKKRMNKGDNHHARKVSDAQMIQAQQWSAEGLTNREIAERLGITAPHVSQLKRGVRCH